MKKAISFICAVNLILLLFVSAVSAEESSTAEIYTSKDIRTVYTVKTGIVDPPAVIEIINTEDKYNTFSSLSNPPQIALFELSGGGFVKAEHSTFPLSDALEKCGDCIIPMFVTENSADAASFSKYVSDNKVYDVLFGSSNTDILKKIYTENSGCVSNVWLAGSFVDSSHLAETVTKSRACGASAVMFDNLTGFSRADAEYLQKRFVNVWCACGNDVDSLNSVFDYGVDGITVETPETAYTVFSSFTETINIRKMFVNSAGGLVNKAPAYSVESMKLALAAGADQITIDVRETADGVVAVIGDDNIRNIVNATKAQKSDLDVPSSNVSKLKFDILSSLYFEPVGSYTKCNISSLSNYLSVFKKQSSDAVIIINAPYSSNVLVNKIAQLVTKNGLASRAVIASPFADNLTFSYNSAPAVGRMLRASVNTEQYGNDDSSFYFGLSYEGKSNKALSFGLEYNFVSAALCSYASARGNSVTAFPVNNKDLFARLFHYGASAADVNDVSEYAGNRQFDFCRTITADNTLGAISTDLTTVAVSEWTDIETVSEYNNPGTGISLYCAENALPENAKLNVIIGNRIDNLYTVIDRLESIGATNISVFDISLLSDGEGILLPQKAVISFPIPDGILEEDVGIFRINALGGIVSYDCRTDPINKTVSVSSAIQGVYIIADKSYCDFYNVPEISNESYENLGVKIESEKKPAFIIIMLIVLTAIALISSGMLAYRIVKNYSQRSIK